MYDPLYSTSKLKKRRDYTHTHRGDRDYRTHTQ